MKKQEQQELLEDALLDEVIGSIKDDINDGDVSAIHGLLSFSQPFDLIMFLSEEKWQNHAVLYAQAVNKSGVKILHEEGCVRIMHKHEVVVGWHKDEWIEDPELVMPAIVNAIMLAQSDIMELRKIVGNPLMVGNLDLSDDNEGIFVNFELVINKDWQEERTESKDFDTLAKQFLECEDYTQATLSMLAQRFEDGSIETVSSERLLNKEK